MQKIVFYSDSGVQEFLSCQDMFQKLSEQGLIVDSVKDGVLTIGGKEYPFAVQTAAGTEAMLVSEVTSYRDDLRASISKLKQQGIEVSKPELQKLAKQFEFLKGSETSTPSE